MALARVHRAYPEPPPADPLGVLRAAHPARIPGGHPALGLEPLTFGAAEASAGGGASGSEAGPARLFRGGGWTLQGAAVEIGGGWQAEASPCEPVPAPPLPEDPALAAARAEARAAERARADALAALRAEVWAEARAEGYAAGRADAEAALRAEAELHKASVSSDLTRLQSALTGALARLEIDLVALALDAAEVVGGAPSEPVRAAVGRAVGQALEGLAAGEGLCGRLHPVDFLRLEEEGLLAALGQAYPGLRWTPDEGLAEGEWVVSSAEAAVRHVRAELLDGLRARLDLLEKVGEGNGEGGRRKAEGERGEGGAAIMALAS